MEDKVDRQAFLNHDFCTGYGDLRLKERFLIGHNRTKRVNHNAGSQLCFKLKKKKIVVTSSRIRSLASQALRSDESSNLADGI